MADSYKDELRNTLVNRSMKTSGPTSSMGSGSGGGPEYPDPTVQTSAVPGITKADPVAPTGLPAPAPQAKAGLPPAWQRYATSLKMQDAVANDWTPNPMLIRLLNGK